MSDRGRVDATVPVAESKAKGSPLDFSYLQPTKYLYFEGVANPGRKTGVWNVRSQSSGDVLGRIAWYGAWRQYVFYPEGETLYNTDCLVVIADRLATCNRWQRNIRANLANARSPLGACPASNTPKGLPMSEKQNKLETTAEQSSVSNAETEYYRVQKLLPSGEWYGWSTRLAGFDSALGHLEASRETGETFRLVRCVVSVEVVEDEGVCEMCSSYEHNHPNMWCREAVIVPDDRADETILEETCAATSTSARRTGSASESGGRDVLRALSPQDTSLAARLGCCTGSGRGSGLTATSGSAPALDTGEPPGSPPVPASDVASLDDAAGGV